MKSVVGCCPAKLPSDMKSYCPVAYGSPMSNSLKRREMGSNAWQLLTCKSVRKRGMKRNPLVLCGAPGGTQWCCSPCPMVAQKSPLRWMKLCQDISVPSQCPKEGVCPGERMGWKMKSPFICTPSIPLLPQPPPHPTPSSWGWKREVFICTTLCFWEHWRKTCKNGARAAEREGWGELELTFQLLLVQKKCFMPFSRVIPGWRPWFAFAVVASTRSCTQSQWEPGFKQTQNGAKPLKTQPLVITNCSTVSGDFFLS